MKRLTRILTVVVMSVLALYLGSFAVLASLGGYTLVPSGHTPSIHLNYSDTYVWQPLHGHRFLYHPRFGGRDLYYMDELGFFYVPLIELVQRFIRPSIAMLRPGETSGSTKVVGTMPPRRQLHPSTIVALEYLKSEFHLSDEDVYSGGK